MWTRQRARHTGVELCSLSGDHRQRASSGRRRRAKGNFARTEIRPGARGARPSHTEPTRFSYPSAADQAGRFPLSERSRSAAVRGRNLAWFGNEEEGLQLIDRAIALDPLNGRQYRYQSEVLTFLRRYPEAVAAARKALKLAPGFEAAHLILGDALLLLGRPVEAKPQYEVIGADNPFRLSSLALLAARTGDPAGAERTIGQLKQQAGAAASFQYAEIYAQLGEKDQAFAELSNAAVAPDPGLIYLKVDPFLDPIRNDPRYAALLRRLNFP